jgi:hypothetical protein
MFVLSKEANKAELEAHMGEDCKLGRSIVRVDSDRVSTQSGSYERGLKFHTTTYVVLMKKPNAMFPEMSYDYGKTWSTCRIDARKSAGRAKIMLKRNTSKEFAYDAIQRINREYGM